MAQTQPANHIMYGYVHLKDGPDCKYKVVFTLTGNTIRGYSITSNYGVDMKAAINGTFNRKKQTVDFIESKLAETPLLSPCYFDVKLTWKVSRGHYIFTGTFTGRNEDNKKCDDGTVTFDVPETQDLLYATKQPKPKKPEPKKQEAVPEPENESHEIIKVTAEMPKEFQWRTDSCILEIWDGEFADGDVVTVLLNGEPVLTNYELIKARKRMVLPLHPKNNTLEIIAETEGKAPPNTSQILLSDGNRSYSLLSRLKTGETATIVMKKK